MKCVMSCVELSTAAAAEVCLVWLCYSSVEALSCSVLTDRMIQQWPRGVFCSFSEWFLSSDMKDVRTPETRPKRSTKLLILNRCIITDSDQ